MDTIAINNWLMFIPMLLTLIAVTGLGLAETARMLKPWESRLRLVAFIIVGIGIIAIMATAAAQLAQAQTHSIVDQVQLRGLA